MTFLDFVLPSRVTKRPYTHAYFCCCGNMIVLFSKLTTSFPTLKPNDQMHMALNTLVQSNNTTHNASICKASIKRVMQAGWVGVHR